MLVNGFAEGSPYWPVAEAHEAFGGSQCPMVEYWVRPVNECSFGYDSFQREATVQCYKKYYVENNLCHYPPRSVPRHEYKPQVRRGVPDLPCQQAGRWDYDRMCYDVGGQPCRYTAVVDLEDFMNNEKRKEKSRVAARCRRTKEMQIFAELTAALPAKKEDVEQLDKASVMRLAISYLRARDVISMLEIGTEQPKVESLDSLEEISSETSYMKALDGFVLVLSQQGDIVYCSENIADHLGVSQMEIMGQSVFEFSHPCDHDEVRDALRNGSGRRDILLRFKCTLTGRGRNVHLKSATYKVIHVTGHMLVPKHKEQNNNVGEDDKKEEGKKPLKTGSLVAVGRPIPHPSNIEIPLDSKTFLTKHSLDMKFTYTDEALKTLGFEPNELLGCSLYDYHHASDSAALIHQFKSLFSKGQCETGQYRFLAKRGGYAWTQTQATVVTDRQQKPVSVVCVHYFISGIECRDEVFAAHQLQRADLKPAALPDGAVVGPAPEERPTPVTELIFTQIGDKEMNKGFYMYSKDEGLTMLKEETDDLVNLAPNAGDACIALDNGSFNMFDDFIFSDNYDDNYCSLLGDELASGSPVDSLLLSSPEPQESDSSCERSSIAELSFDGIKSENEAEDGNAYAPAGDELPVLEPAVMWGALPDSVSLARPHPPEQQSSPAPALQRLLVAAPTGPPPQDLVTSIYSDQGLIPSGPLSSWETGAKRAMSHEEQSSPKRIKRSPSPARAASSVLMNLLDVSRCTPEPLPELLLEPALWASADLLAAFGEVRLDRGSTAW